MKQVCLGLICALAFGCKKSDTPSGDKCGNRGGFIPNYYRVFYKTKDFGNGPVKITVAQNGNTFEAGSLSLYFPNGGVSCSTTQGVVKAALTTGYDATYLATDGTNTFRGTIPYSCDANSCETIEIK